MATVYKVVRKTSKGYVSAVAGATDNVWKTVQASYQYGIETKPPMTRSCLMAFKTKLDAESWIGEMQRFRILRTGPTPSYHLLECEARISRSKKRRIPPVWELDQQMDKIRKFWQGSNIGTFPMPDGTVLCTSITPRKYLGFYPAPH